MAAHFQRVVRGILREWLLNPPTGWRVEPVYATADTEYRYARRFSLNFIECQPNLLVDEPIEVAPGDVFVGLDLQPDVTPARQEFYQRIRRQGACVKFIVYDLLPILLPAAFPDGTSASHSKWLKIVAQSDGAVCISRSVADELRAWLQDNGPPRERPLNIGWFHLGADVGNSVPSIGLPGNANHVLQALRARPTFLSVGTIEPRKGHAQMLAAFELLWRAGQDVNLVLVGKQGWMVEALVKRLRNHPEHNKRLFWLEGISDEYLEKVYAAGTCLIAASEGEGFGAPVIEAAQHKLPVIARDIPVFREVAGVHAAYFSGKNPEDLAGAIQDWLPLHASGQHPRSDNMPWLTWAESARQLLTCIGIEPDLRGTEA
jgi:glycosyltransferase involved in cell wall biosynthesis